MWNQELRSKVLNRLRSLPSLKDHEIQEDDVHVMPYEEVQLLFKPNSVHQASIQLFNEPTPYVLLNETLDFYLLCESAPIANLLAQDLRRNPGSTLKGLKLVMECRGLSLGNAVNSTIPKRPIFAFNLSANTKESQDDQDSSAADEIENDDMLTATHLNEMIPVPVFGVAGCRTPRDMGCSIKFFRNSFPTKIEYGNFDLQSGIFTVLKPGIYQFTLSALQEVVEEGYLTNIELRVDGVKKGEFLSQSDWNKEGYEPIFLSSTVTLKQGQKVGIFLTDGELYPASPDYPTRFSGIFFSD